VLSLSGCLDDQPPLAPDILPDQPLVTAMLGMPCMIQYYNTVDECARLIEAIEALVNHQFADCRELGESAWERYWNGGFAMHSFPDFEGQWMVFGHYTSGPTHTQYHFVSEGETHMHEVDESLWMNTFLVAHEEFHHRGYSHFAYGNIIDSWAADCAIEGLT